jgi:sugar diacid utilization regulator
VLTDPGSDGVVGAMDDVLDPALRDRMSNLYGVFAVSMMLFSQVDADRILGVVEDAVPTLGPFRVEGALLLDHRAGRPPRRTGRLGPAQRDALLVLAGAEGPVPVAEAAWARAYPLHAVGAHAGYLVVAAAREPTEDEQFLVRTLAQQAGAALACGGLYLRERAASSELRERIDELASLNDDLTATVAELERRARTHELLTRVVTTGGAEPGIVAALHELTRHDVVAEDTFGNVLASAGDGTSRPPTRSGSPAAREALLDRARRHGRPLRHRDRVIALAQPRDEVLGLLSLADPAHRAGDFELFALECASVVLAMELAHQRSLAEQELRLRGDLVEDLLSGVDDAGVAARAVALGHDLHVPHQVVVIAWPGAGGAEEIARAVEPAATRLTRGRPLLTSRHGRVVLIAPAQDGEQRGEWTRLHAMLCAALPAPAGSIGVGRPSAGPAGLPRSYEEASRALRVRQSATEAAGVTCFDALGFYRVLGGGESNHEVDEFVQEWLGPLVEYDRTHHYDLVNTLCQYYECGGNYDATAARLVIHRSTLRYRLRRIRELTGYDLGAVDIRLNLHIAARAWQIGSGST